MVAPFTGLFPSTRSSATPILSDRMMEMMHEMRTRIDAMDNKFHELRIGTDRCLSILEQPDSPVREHRPPQVDREFND